MRTCREVSRAIASGSLDEAGWRERLSIRLHLLICRHCRSFAAQIRRLGELARDLTARRQEDPETLRRLEERILKGLRGDRSDPP